MFENRLMRETHGPKNDEVIESWSKRRYLLLRAMKTVDRMLRDILGPNSEEVMEGCRK
jgi:hypothetical protein